MNYKTYLKSAAMVALGTMVVYGAQAQPAPEADQADSDAVQETVIVTGARGKARSLADSPVPVDVLSDEELNAVPFTDTNDILKTLVPSYSLARQPISDGATFIRPATLRGLPTDKTLVLVNSKRRHRAALVSIGGSGTQGPDLATIPAVALKSVEVLRDGAAAQYGSDAIAGVINFILDDSAEGGTVTAEMGQFYEGDGFNYVISGNYGFGLGENGFVNVSAEIMDQEATVRAEEYCQSWACVDPNDPDFLGGSSFDNTLAFYDEDTFIAGLADANIGDGNVVQPWGIPNAEAVRGFVNAGYTVSPALELYGFGNYSWSKGDGSFFYRYPGNGTIEDIRLSDGSVWSPLALFPGGFTPRFEGEIIDYSMLGGAKGEFENGWFYDVSARFGSNEIKYTLMNTINPSLGPDSPTSFRPGDLVNEEFQIQADISKEFEVGLASPLVFLGGVTYMDETYEVVEGGVASYIDGPYALQDPHGFCNDDGTATASGLSVIANGSSLDCSDSSDPVFRVVGVGSNGFPGYSPEFASEYTRDSMGVYFDLSADVTDKLFLQGAVRYEDYSDFGAETVYKIAGQYDLTENIGLRGSIGTGFRAPTPGQQGTTNVSTRLPNGFPVATGLFPSGGPVAQALGAEELIAETSNNYTLGATASFGDFTLTVDLYRIELSDRLNAISTQDVSATDPGAEPVASDFTDADDFADALSDWTADRLAYDNFLALQGAGVVGAESIGGVFYFQNAFDTVTEGVDIVATYTKGWDSGATTTLTGSVNYNTVEFEGDVNEFFNAESQFDFLNGIETRGVFTVVHDLDQWSFLGRASYYGPYENAQSSSLATIYDFDAEWFVDLEATYRPTDMISLSAGARNVFDTYPNNDPEDCCGRLYDSGSIVDWQGGYYYGKVRVTF